MELNRVSENTWEIPRTGEMRVPAVVYASHKLLGTLRSDKTLDQARNVACLPGILKASYVMPDGHQGYGFPIGGVAAFDLDEGVISPGGVGYDINCGVRLLRTDFTEEDVSSKRKELLAEIFKEVPAGVGKGGITKLEYATYCAAALAYLMIHQQDPVGAVVQLRRGQALDDAAGGHHVSENLE